MYYGNAHNLKITVAAGNGAEQDINSIVRSEKLLKITPTVDMYILLTAVSSVATADADDYLIKANAEYEFAVGTGIDRIALWNATGGSGDAHVMIMY